MIPVAPVFDPAWERVRERDLEELIEARRFGPNEVQELKALRAAHEGRNDEQHD